MKGIQKPFCDLFLLWGQETGYHGSWIPDWGARAGRARKRCRVESRSEAPSGILVRVTRKQCWQGTRRSRLEAVILSAKPTLLRTERLLAWFQGDLIKKLMTWPSVSPSMASKHIMA